MDANKLDLQLSEIDKTDFALGYAGVLEIDKEGSISKTNS